MSTKSIVVVVDSEERVRASLAVNLELEGHEVSEAAEAIDPFMSRGGYACRRKPYPFGERVPIIARARGDAAKS